jgi:hypothetical protein
VLDIDISVPAEKRRIKAMIDTWVKTGALKEVERQAENRHPKLFVEVGNWANI